MKYSEAWAKLAQQNINFKILSVILAATTIALAFSTVRLSLKGPFIVERTCFNQVLDKKDSSRTKDEIKTFLKIALMQRFNTKDPAFSTYLSNSEIKKKQIEIKDFQQKNISQSILVSNIQLKEDQIIISADRLFSVGNIRSAFQFPILAKVELNSRTADNPYGLTLVSTEEIKKDKGEKQ